MPRRAGPLSSYARSSHYRAPGPLIGPDCERMSGLDSGEGEFDGRPTGVGRRAVRFSLPCSSRRTRCRARLELRWRGRLIDARTFVAAKGRRVPLRLRLRPDLWRAMRRGGATVALELRDYDEWEEESLGDEYRVEVDLALARRAAALTRGGTSRPSPRWPPDDRARPPRAMAHRATPLRAA